MNSGLHTHSTTLRFPTGVTSSNLNARGFGSPFTFSSPSTTKHDHWHFVEVCPTLNKPPRCQAEDLCLKRGSEVPCTFFSTKRGDFYKEVAIPKEPSGILISQMSSLFLLSCFVTIEKITGPFTSRHPTSL